MERKEHRLPIDRGWAWVITFASCGMFGFVTASFKSQGIVLVELQELYPDKTVDQILWVFSMSTLTNRLSAPLNGLILTKTSHRVLGLLGVSLCSSCLVAFAYVERLEYMYPVYGFGYGLGAGMITLTTFTAYGAYFDKRKALSLGITAAGSGVMTMIVPNILRVLFDNFSFPGAILLFSCICVQLFIPASLLRPMSFYEKFAKPRPTVELNSRDEEYSAPKLDNISEEVEFRERSFSMTATTPQSNTPTTPFLSTPDMTKIPIHHNNSHHHTAYITAYSLEDISAPGILFEPNPAAEEASRSKESTLNWRLVYNPRCLLLGAATLAYVSGLSITYQCVPSLGKESDVSKTFITYAIAGAGLLEVPMRMFNGWFADSKILSPYTHITLCMTFTGLAAVLCASISSHAGIVLMLIGTSSTGTSVISLLPIVSVELMGKENLYSAMSINYFYQGLSLIISTFSSAAIYESTKQWENVFFFIGGCNLLGAVIMLIIIALLAFHHRF